MGYYRSSPYWPYLNPNKETQIVEELLFNVTFLYDLTHEEMNYDQWIYYWLNANIDNAEIKLTGTIPGAFPAAAIDARDPNHIKYWAVVWNSNPPTPRWEIQMIYDNLNAQ